MGEKLSKTLTSCGMELISNLTMKSMTISARPPRKSMVTKTITMKLEDSRMGDQMKNGMVLAMSLWDDLEANMLWLDSDYPVGCDPSTPTDHGCHRGPCPVDSGVPDEVEEQYPDAGVTYGNPRVGDIDTTYLDRLY